MTRALAIRTDLASPAQLRAWARRERAPRAAMRMPAIAHAPEGMGRAAARLAGMERQALRDAVTRYDAEGLTGLRGRPSPGRSPALPEAGQVALLAVIFRGPDRARERCAEWIEGRFDNRLHPASLSRIIRRLDLSRQKTRPRHPQADEKAKAAVAEGGSCAPWKRWRSPIRTSASSCGSRMRCAWG